MILIENLCFCSMYRKTCVKRPFKKKDKDLNDNWWLKESCVYQMHVAKLPRFIHLVYTRVVPVNRGLLL